MAGHGPRHDGKLEGKKNFKVSVVVYNHEYFMRQALDQAKQAFEQNEVPVGAVIVANNKIIAKAHNQTEQLNDSTAHAEMLALTAAFNYLGTKYLTECSMYLSLEPCTMCAGAMFWAQLGQLFIAAPDEKRGYARLQTPVLHPKTKVHWGLMEQESVTLLKTFFSRLR